MALGVMVQIQPHLQADIVCYRSLYARLGRSHCFLLACTEYSVHTIMTRADGTRIPELLTTEGPRPGLALIVVLYMCESELARVKVGHQVAYYYRSTQWYMILRVCLPNSCCVSYYPADGASSAIAIVLSAYCGFSRCRSVSQC